MMSATTPPLPRWITEADVPGYVAAHRLCPGETRLYGTESLYGDWDGQILLLAKDFAHSGIVRTRLQKGETRAYRHEPGVLTNQRLHRLAEPFVSHGLLYGSALANLLRDDGRMSGALPNWPGAYDYGTRVTRFAIENMPNLAWIVCMGREAWLCARAALGLEGRWEEHRDSGIPLGRLFAAYHPAARISRRELERPWAALRRVLGTPDGTAVCA